ncbi:hypothetical protein SDC9_144120 [bioreactor metagenome]|uniref:Uncharacterized protein n=1 Tax=bioreactor metagenome TaxID=1076179 RepID=A0A645E584_9ZZZZ
MFAGLRHDALIGVDDQEDHVDALGSRQHVLDKALMAGYIDDAYPPAGRQVEIGKAEVDGHAALDFLFGGIRGDAGQRLDQGRFAVINVSGGANDDICHYGSNLSTVRLLPSRSN